MNSSVERFQIFRIADALVRPHLFIGMSKAKAKEQNKDGIRSLGTAAKTKMHIRGFLEFRNAARLETKGPYLQCHMQEYLHYLVEDLYDQRYINSTKRALELVFSVRLESVDSEVQVSLGPRNYSPDEVSKIIARQGESNALITRLCFEAGLRAHETFALRRVDEVSREPGRKWDSRLFAGLTDYTTYVVHGKGGLRRHVAIPNDLAAELEARRIPSLQVTTDRAIKYDSLYKLGGGQAFSQSFSTACKKAEVPCRGAHGLRHSYAKRRFVQLKMFGFSTEDTLLILSQELGHFRPGIVLTYLR